MVRIRRAAMAAVLLAVLAPSHAAQAAFLYDFGARDVIIWSEPRAGSTPVGLGQPGEGFESEWSQEREPYQCEWFDSVLWHHGRNTTTGVAGWVPACELDDSD